MYILTFVITALYDVVLQLLLRGKIPNIFGVLQSDWLRSLIPYFQRHTPLAAALIAGFVGAVTQYIIQLFARPGASISFLAVTFLFSGAFGFVMKGSGLFPILDATYYKTLGPVRAFFTDAYSGLVVNLTLLAYMNRQIILERLTSGF